MKDSQDRGPSRQELAEIEYRRKQIQKECNGDRDISGYIKMLEETNKTLKNSYVKKPTICVTYMTNVMTHFRDGGKVEVTIKGLLDSGWTLAPKPCWDWSNFIFRMA